MTKQHTVLIADDDDAVRDALVDVLTEQLGCKIVEARDGTEAVAALRANDVDVAVIDHRMPGMTGAAVIRQAREEGLKVPIILITAAVDVRALAEQLGIDLFLGKPFSTDQLVTLIRRALAIDP